MDAIIITGIGSATIVVLKESDRTGRLPRGSMGLTVQQTHSFSNILSDLLHVFITNSPMHNYNYMLDL